MLLFVQRSNAFQIKHQPDLLLPIESSVRKGANSCPNFFKFGAPYILDTTTSQRSFFSCRRAYASMYDPNLKVPIWVAEHLVGKDTKGSASRNNIDFIQDPLVPSIYQASHQDYFRSGYQKGHMAPAADFKNDQVALNESFLFTNSIPQAPQQNMRVWNYLESSVRQLLRRRQELYVVTGPVFLNPRPNKINNSVSVPDAVFKVIHDPSTDTMTAFMVPNGDSVSDDFTQYQTTVREIEKKTGINFNPKLTRSQADTMEVNGGDIIMPKFVPRER